MKRKTFAGKAHHLRPIGERGLRKRIVHLQVSGIQESAHGRLTQMTRDAVHAALDAWHTEIDAQ